MTLADRILVVLLVMIAAALFFTLPGRVLSGGTHVAIVVSGHLVGSYSLGEDRLVEVKGPLGTTVVEIAKERARVTSSPCPHKVCVGMGAKGREGGVIVCVPNEVVVTVGTEGPHGLDAVSR